MNFGLLPTVCKDKMLKWCLLAIAQFVFKFFSQFITITKLSALERSKSKQLMLLRPKFGDTYLGRYASMLGAALRQEKQPLCNYFLTYMLLRKSEFNQAGRPCLIEEHGGSRNVRKSGGLQFRAGSLSLI